MRKKSENNEFYQKPENKTTQNSENRRKVKKGDGPHNSIDKPPHKPLIVDGRKEVQPREKAKSPQLTKIGPTKTGQKTTLITGHQAYKPQKQHSKPI
jgi:hypothetical protein